MPSLIQSRKVIDLISKGWVTVAGPFDTHTTKIGGHVYLMNSEQDVIRISSSGRVERPNGWYVDDEM